MNDLKRTFLRVLIASLLATAALAIGFLLLADFNERTWKVIGTTALLSAFSLLGLPGAALLDKGRAVLLGWANLLLAAVGLTGARAHRRQSAEGRADLGPCEQRPDGEPAPRRPVPAA